MSENILFFDFQFIWLFFGNWLSNPGAQLGGGGVGRHPLPFFENRKHWSDFGKKGPDCVHLWVKFSIQNVVLKVSRRKKSQIFPCGSFFLLFLTKCLSKCPSFTKPPLPWKFFGCAPANSQLNVFPNYLIQTI